MTTATCVGKILSCRYVPVHHSPPPFPLKSPANQGVNNGSNKKSAYVGKTYTAPLFLLSVEICIRMLYNNKQSHGGSLKRLSVSVVPLLHELFGLQPNSHCGFYIQLLYNYYYFVITPVVCLQFYHCCHENTMFCDNIYFKLWVKGYCHKQSRCWIGKQLLKGCFFRSAKFLNFFIQNWGIGNTTHPQLFEPSNNSSRFH